MTFKDLDWFELHLEHIDSPEDFEEAMEEAHVRGFEDGFEAGEEEGYNAGIYSSVVDDRIKDAVQVEKERILNWIHERRSYMELEAGIGVYRDHFTAEELMDFIRTDDWKPYSKEEWPD